MSIDEVIDLCVDKLDEIINDYVEFNPPMNEYEQGYEDGCEKAICKAIAIIEDMRELINEVSNG